MEMAMHAIRSEIKAKGNAVPVTSATPHKMDSVESVNPTKTVDNSGARVRGRRPRGKFEVVERFKVGANVFNNGNNGQITRGE